MNIKSGFFIIFIGFLSFGKGSYTKGLREIMSIGIIPLSLLSAIRHIFFGGNLIKQPAYKNATIRKVGHLTNTDIVLSQVFWLGVTPMLTERQLSYVTESLSELVSQVYQLQTV